MTVLTFSPFTGLGEVGIERKKIGKFAQKMRTHRYEREEYVSHPFPIESYLHHIISL